MELEVPSAESRDSETYTKWFEGHAWVEAQIEVLHKVL